MINICTATSIEDINSNHNVFENNIALQCFYEKVCVKIKIWNERKKGIYLIMYQRVEANQMHSN